MFILIPEELEPLPIIYGAHITFCFPVERVVNQNPNKITKTMKKSAKML